MGLSDYSSMEQEIRSTPEMKTLPRGAETKVRIVSVNSGISDKDGSQGARWFMPTFDCPDDPYVKEFNTFMWDPLTYNNIADPKKVARSKDQFNRFTKCFKIDLSKPFSWEDDLPGKIGWIIVGVQSDDQYGDKNTVSKFVIGPQGAPAATKGTDY